MDGVFYLGSQKFNVNNVQFTGLIGDWKADVLKYPESRYYMKVNGVDCILKRSENLRYYGTVILKPTDRFYKIPNLYNFIVNDLVDFLEDNGYKLDWHYASDSYYGDLRYVSFGFWDIAKVGFVNRYNYYYPFDDAKKMLEGIAKYFSERNKYSFDSNDKSVVINNIRYTKLA